MPSSVTLLKAARKVHLYVGVFIAPALLFFAFTGAVQTFSLHETPRGSSYKPPRILVILGQIHKNQTPIVPVRKPPPEAAPAHSTAPTPPTAARTGNPAPAPSPAPGAPPTPTAPTAAPPAQHNPLPLKIFFLLVALGLFTSTLTGIYMSYKYTRNKLAISILLILGAVLPLAMILL